MRALVGAARRYVALAVVTTLIANVGLVLVAAAPEASAAAQGDVAGTVTSTSSGGPLADICVDLYQPGVAGASYGTCTLADGSYDVGEVAPGSYDVGFTDPTGQYVTQWYTGSAGGSAARSGAVAMTVASGQALGGVDASMSPSSASTGNFISDGCFGSPDVGTSYEVFGTGQSFDGWLVVGASGNVAPVSGAFQWEDDGTGIDFSFPAVPGCDQWMDLTGVSNTQTGISQTVETQPGATYQLDFSVGNVVDPGGLVGTSSTVDVLVDGQQLVAATNSGGGSTLSWEAFSEAFTATGSSTTVEFLNADPPTDNTNGLDAVSLTYLAPAAVTAVSPASGPAGTTVTVTGTGFAGVSAVDFGTVAATSFSVTGPTSLTATAPAGSGTVAVTVTTALGTSATSSADQFSYVPASYTPVNTTAYARLTGSGAEALGSSVALDSAGTEALVVAPAAAGGGGAVYVYTWSGGTWSEAASFTGSAGSQFGTSVALSADGTTALVGAPGSDAAYVYTSSGGTWPTSATASFTGPGSFGTSVALDAAGQSALVGAPGAYGGDDGSAYLYSYYEGTWPTTPVAGLGGGCWGCREGTSVALSGNGGTALVGAPGVGQVAVYTSSAGSWSQAVALPGPAVLGLAADGTVALVGSPSASGGNGAAYVYTSSAGAWPATAAATFTGRLAEALGTSGALSADGETTLVGVPGASSGDGAAYVYGPAPVVTALSPKSGPTAGATIVTVTGQHLTGASAVDFGTVAAMSFTVNNDGSVTAVSPPEPAGTVDVTVTTPGGTSATSTADQFTYAVPVAAGSATT
jgi:hypothetical protein